MPPHCRHGVSIFSITFIPQNISFVATLSSMILGTFRNSRTDKQLIGRFWVRGWQNCWHPFRSAFFNCFGKSEDRNLRFCFACASHSAHKNYTAAYCVPVPQGGIMTLLMQKDTATCGVLCCFCCVMRPPQRDTDTCSRHNLERRLRPMFPVAHHCCSRCRFLWLALFVRRALLGRENEPRNSARMAGCLAAGIAMVGTAVFLHATTSERQFLLTTQPITVPRTLTGLAAYPNVAKPLYKNTALLSHTTVDPDLSSASSPGSSKPGGACAHSHGVAPDVVGRHGNPSIFLPSSLVLTC